MRGVAPGVGWSFYCNNMTNPDEKPSFLARLAIVVTFGVMVLQLFLVIVASWQISYNRDRTISDGVNIIFGVGILPVLAYITVAGIYYLFKGKPTNVDIVVTSRLYRAWVISLIGGVVYAYFFIRWWGEG